VSPEIETEFVGKDQMPAWLRNERVENMCFWLAGLMLATSLLLLIAVIITGTRLLEPAIMIAVYLMFASFAICMAINSLALIDLLTTILRSVKRSR
jgi:hypothetical protein